MLQILTLVLIMESCLALLLVSRIKPLVKTACLIVDITKTTRGSAVTKTLAATLLVLLASSVTTFVQARQHMLEHHGSEVHGSPAEFFMKRTAELESALSGFILLLALMINRGHFFLREAEGLKLSLDVLKKQSKEQKTEGESLLELKGIVEEMREKVEKMQVQAQIKEKEVKAAEASVLAIQKQSEGIRLEYKRLIDDNENLRNQLASVDRNQDRLELKKNT